VLPVLVLTTQATFLMLKLSMRLDVASPSHTAFTTQPRSAQTDIALREG
jgi:hypothetical protein